MDEKKLLKVLRESCCDDPFECIFGMYGKNKRGCYGCFAKMPNGDPNEQNQGCVAHQAADLIEKLLRERVERQ